MAVMQVKVRYDDGTEVEASIGQRDVARWEAQPFGGQKAIDEKPVTFARYVSWSALQRSRQARDLPWPRWDEIVDEVEVIETDDAPVDPTGEVVRATA